MLEYIEAAKTIIEVVKGLRTKSSESPADNLYQVTFDEKALPHHLRYAKNWSSSFLVGGGARRRDTKEAFVRLALCEGQVHARLSRSSAPTIGPEELLVPGQHGVILGQPGAGKTTLFRHLCRHTLLEEPRRNSDTFEHPLLVECRDLAPDELLVERLCRVLGFRIAVDPNRVSTRIESKKAIDLVAEAKSREKEYRELVLCEALNSRPLLVLIDGLDEVGATRRDRLIAELNAILPAIDETTVLAACRFGALTAPVQQAQHYAIQPFDDADIREFCRRWFKGRPKVAKAFNEELAESPYHSLSRTPLHIANLCLVYDAKGELPDNPIRVYESIVNLRLEVWDRERAVRRESRYGKQFGPDDKRRFLAALSFQLGRNNRRGRFTDRDLVTAYRAIASRFGLPSAEAEEVAAEIESHTGLVVQLDDINYEFYHLSIFEYLCGDHISRLQIDHSSVRDLLNLPEPAAIATALAAEPDRFALHLAVRLQLGEEFVQAAAREYADFWKRYISRIESERILLPPTVWTGLALVCVSAFCWSGRTSEWGEPVFREELEPLNVDLVRHVERWGLRMAVREAIKLFEFHAPADDHVILGARDKWPRELRFKPKRMFIDRRLYDSAATAHLSRGAAR